MSHELEYVNGHASYVGREPAWHRLGTVFQDGLTYEKAIQTANLNDWNVRAEPLVATVGKRSFQIEDKQAILRDNPADAEVEVIAVVGDRYRAVQNEQAFAVAPFLEELGAKVETAGSIRGGRQVFLTLTMPNGVVIDPSGAGDAINNYLALWTSHDGSLAVEASATPVRVVCANTLDAALGDAKRAYKVRHTATAQDRLAEAQQIFLRANRYFEAVAEEAAKLIQVEVDNKAFFEIVQRVYPKPGTEGGPAESKRGKTVWTKKVDKLHEILNSQTNTNIKGTAWGAYSAMTERIDWHRKARGGDGSSIAIAASGVAGPAQDEKSLIRKAVVGYAAEVKPKLFA